MSKENSNYHTLNGKWVIVVTSARDIVGKLESDTEENLTLKPSLVYEPRVATNSAGQGFYPFYRVEEKLSTLISTKQIIGVQPTTEEYVKRISV